MRYRKVDPRMWNDEKFSRLTDDGKLAFIFILTHPNMTAIGAMRATSAGLAAELGWQEGRFQDAIRDAMSDGLLDVSEKGLFWGLPNFLKYNEPEGPNSVSKAWISALDYIPECPEKHRVIARCAKYLHSRTEKFKKALPDAIWDAFPDGMSDGKSDASPIPEPEPEPDLNPPISPKRGQRSSSHNGKAKSDFTAEVTTVISRINELSGKEYAIDSKVVNAGLVARLKEGVSLDECLLVINDRWAEWRNSADMKKHFNPETLFRPSKFEKYRVEARANGRRSAATEKELPPL